MLSLLCTNVISIFAPAFSSNRGDKFWWAEKIFSTPFFHSYLHPILTKENSICSSSSIMSFPSSCFHLNKRSVKGQIGLCEGCRAFFLIIKLSVLDIGLENKIFLLFSLILLLFMSFITLFGIIHKSYCIISITF